jgi:carbamate kinase
MNPALLESGMKIAVIALGGNAILRKGQKASPQVQLANIREAIHNLENVLDVYHTFAITHGNGPQVGNDLIRSYTAAEHEGLPELDLVDCGANTQGRIGHWLIHEMKRNPIFAERKIACVLTHVYVDKDTFAPDEYTKYIGPWRPNNPETRARFDARAVIYKSPAGSEESIRRVVPSPSPYAIEEIDIIDQLLNGGVITICCGGGGIPVYNPTYEDNLNGSVKGGETFQRSEVVIDKDRASSILAISLLEKNPTIEVHLIILADVKGLYRTPELRDEDFIPDMSYEELKAFREQTKLDPGSIGPKVEAICDFLDAGGRHAYFGPLDEFPLIFDPSSPVGTHFHRTQQLNMFGKEGK